MAVSAGAAKLRWDAWVRVWVKAAASPREGDAKGGRQRQEKITTAPWHPTGSTVGHLRESLHVCRAQSRINAPVCTGGGGKRTLCPLQTNWPALKRWPTQIQNFWSCGLLPALSSNRLSLVGKAPSISQPSVQGQQHRGQDNYPVKEISFPIHKFLFLLKAGGSKEALPHPSASPVPSVPADLRPLLSPRMLLPHVRATHRRGTPGR